MMGPILALCTFGDRLTDADVIVLIGTEVVEAVLVKGYATKADVCELISTLDLRCRIFIDRVSD